MQAQPRRSFLRRDRLAGPVRLEDVVTPEQEDAAQDYATDAGMGGVTTGDAKNAFGQQTVVEAAPVNENLFGLEAEPRPQSAAPSNRSRQMAEQLLAHGEKPFSTGAGWWGVADRVAATGVGSWMEGRENEREAETKKGALKEFLGSLDETDPVHKFAKTVAMQGDVNKATDLIFRHETQKEIAKMRASASGGSGYKQRTYNKAGQEITEQSQDGGKTWQPLSTDARFKPQGAEGEGLSSENASYYADAFIRTGDKSIFLRMPYKDVSKIRNLIPKIASERGLSPEQISSKVAEFSALGAGLRTVATQQAKIDTIAAEASLFADQALAASKKIPRGKFIPVNKLIQDWGFLNSNPLYYQFVLTNTDLAHAMAGVAGRGVTNQHLQELFEQRLNTAASHEAYAAMTTTVKAAAKAIMAAPAQTRKHIIADYVGKLGGDPKKAMAAISRDQEIEAELKSKGELPEGGAAAAPVDDEWETGTHKNGRKVRRRKGTKAWEYY